MDIMSSAVCFKGQTDITNNLLMWLKKIFFSTIKISRDSMNSSTLLCCFLSSKVFHRRESRSQELYQPESRDKELNVEHIICCCSKKKKKKIRFYTHFKSHQLVAFITHCKFDILHIRLFFFLIKIHF